MIFFSKKKLAKSVFHDFFAVCNSSEKIEIWNDYCQNKGDISDMLYKMDYFNVLFQDDEPTELARKIVNGYFDASHPFYKFDSNSITSITSIEEGINLEALYEWFVDEYPKQVDDENWHNFKTFCDTTNHYVVELPNEVEITTIYIVVNKYNAEGCTEFDILGTFTNQESARNLVREQKNTILNDYYAGTKYEIESDTEDIFQVQREDWYYFEEVYILEKKLNS